jgi:hypothetical protein
LSGDFLLVFPVRATGMDVRDVEDGVGQIEMVSYIQARKVKRMIKQLLTRSVVPDTVVARLGQVVCFGGACVIPVLVFRKFAELEFSEAQLLIGVLITMSMALVFTVLGVLLESKSKAA